MANGSALAKRKLTRLTQNKKSLTNHSSDKLINILEPIQFVKRSLAAWLHLTGEVSRSRNREDYCKNTLWMRSKASSICSSCGTSLALHFGVRPSFTSKSQNFCFLSVALQFTVFLPCVSSSQQCHSRQSIGIWLGGFVSNYPPYSRSHGSTRPDSWQTKHSVWV